MIYLLFVFDLLLTLNLFSAKRLTPLPFANLRDSVFRLKRINNRADTVRSTMTVDFIMFGQLAVGKTQAQHGSHCGMRLVICRMCIHISSVQRGNLIISRKVKLVADISRPRSAADRCQRSSEEKLNRRKPLTPEPAHEGSGTDRRNQNGRS